jgi:hypothetical protein
VAKGVMHFKVSEKFFLKSDKISLDVKMGNLIESSLKNEANFRVTNTSSTRRRTKSISEKIVRRQAYII